MSGTQRKKNCLVMNLNYGPIFSNFCTPGVGLMLVYNFYVLMSKIQPKKKKPFSKDYFRGAKRCKERELRKDGHEIINFIDNRTKIDKFRKKILKMSSILKNAWVCYKFALIFYKIANCKNHNFNKILKHIR